MVITGIVGDKSDSNHKSDWLHGWQGPKDPTSGIPLIFPAKQALSSAMQTFLVIFECPNQSLKVSSQSVTERLKKTKFRLLMWLADQCNE